jgi:rod shape-determining protein MreD
VAIDLIRYLLGALILLFFQFFLIQEINFGAWLKPMPYVLFIFLLPFNYNRFLILLAAFFAGLFLDALNNSGGLHAAACSTLAFGRIIADTRILDTDAIQLQGFRYLLLYFLIFSGFVGFPHQQCRLFFVNAFVQNHSRDQIIWTYTATENLFTWAFLVW